MDPKSSENCLKYTIGKLPSIDFLATHPHFVVATHNLNVGFSDSVDEDLKTHAIHSFDSLKYSANYPQPFLPAADIPVSEVNGTDPCDELVLNKRLWEKRKKTLMVSCKKHKSFASEVLSKPQVPNTLRVPSKNILLLADHLKEDPDKYFEGTYNWYYSGGNLKTVILGGKTYLLHPSHEKRGEILLTSLYRIGDQWKSNPQDTRSLIISESEGGHIFQIESCNGDFLVRQRNSISFCQSITTEPSIKFEKAKINREGAPYLGIDMRPGAQGDFCSVTSEGIIQLWSAPNKSLLEKGEITEGFQRKGGWKTVKFIDGSTFFYADRDVVHVVDTRIGVDTSQKSWSFDGLTENCEEICALNHNDHSYIVTNHQLFTLDVRQGITQRWTHGVPTSPFLIEIVTEGRKDRVFLASQKSDCVALVENEWDSQDSGKGKYHPFILPSLQESLHSARINGAGASYLIDSRFNACLTGLCILEGDTLDLLRLTSYGDVFSQHLVKGIEPTVQDFSDEEIHELSQWTNTCEELYLRRAERKATHLYSRSDILEEIEEGRLASTCEGNEKQGEEKEGKLKQDWLISKKKLLSYCDFLAPKILQAWDLDNEPEWGDENEEESEESMEEGEDDDFEFKVLNWINNYTKPDGNSEPSEKTDTSGSCSPMDLETRGEAQPKKT